MKAFIKRFLLIFSVLSLLILPNVVYAAENDAITNTLCKVITMIQGTLGKAISVIIVVSLAIALFLGKVSWGLAIATLIGISLLFGSTTIVNKIAGGGEELTCDPATATTPSNDVPADSSGG